MRRRKTLRAKVLRRFHNSAAEDRLPKVIYCHTSCQRIVATDQPLRQTEAVRRRIFGKRTQKRRNIGFHQITFANKGASQPYVGGWMADLGVFGHDERPWDIESINLFFELSDF